MSNGRLDTRDLAVIPGGTRMGGDALIRADLLPGLVALQAAYAKRWGAPLRPTSAADGYRSYEVQRRTFLARYVPARTGEGPFSDVRWWAGRRYVRISSAGSAAVPGTSNHGWAVAVDFADVGPRGGQRWDWLMDNAPRFGWTNPAWARDDNPRNGSVEPWHWESTAVPVSQYLAYLEANGIEVPGLTPPDPITPLPLEDDMKLIRDESTGSLALVGETYVGEFGGADQAGIAAAAAVFGEWKDVPTDVYRTAVERAAGRMRDARSGLTAEQLAAQITPTLLAAIRDAGTGATPEQVEEAVRNVLRSV